jgi:hypothetical protein
MKWSAKIFENGNNEILGSLNYVGGEKEMLLMWNHGELVKVPNADNGDNRKRVVAVVPEEGEAFVLRVLDVMTATGVDDQEGNTDFDLSSYGEFIDGAPVYVIDEDGEVLAEGVMASDVAVFDGDWDWTGLQTLAFIYTIQGYKGFLSVPVVGEQVWVEQVTGSREVSFRMFDEGDLNA